MSGLPRRSCKGCYQAENHVIVELYASGNVILTDKSYTIMNVLRQHAPEEVPPVSLQYLL